MPDLNDSQKATWQQALAGFTAAEFDLSRGNVASAQKGASYSMGSLAQLPPDSPEFIGGMARAQEILARADALTGAAAAQLKADAQRSDANLVTKVLEANERARIEGTAEREARTLERLRTWGAFGGTFVDVGADVAEKVEKVAAAARAPFMLAAGALGLLAVAFIVWRGSSVAKVIA